MGNKQGSLGHHLDTASKTGALAFPSKVCNYILPTQDKSKSKLPEYQLYRSRFI